MQRKFCHAENMADKDTYTKFREWLKSNYTDSIPSDMNGRQIKMKMTDFNITHNLTGLTLKRKFFTILHIQKDAQTFLMNLMGNITTLTNFYHYSLNPTTYHCY